MEPFGLMGLVGLMGMDGLVWSGVFLGWGGLVGLVVSLGGVVWWGE